MKTAEEWSEELGEHTEYPYDLEEPRVYPNITPEQVEQIQLDAMKEGMRRAGEVAQNKENWHLDEMEGADWKEFVTAETLMAQAHDLKKAIITASEQLTKEDL